ncbi:hypothetical protein ACFPVT_08345 [Corynebacterium choanae]|uniref:Antitoxin n=1 Tax=Corynebacterium choanae TaxID=1862358 RepID=A0A3G6JDA8_9CORY|nr:hypothetical protein [Corynebacterium choanae]AZA14134.1 hypothetical protein CCHOA_08730 [Corynebacterium choanae]
MGLGDMVNKAKDAVAANRDKIENEAGKLIDKKLDPSKADKVKGAVDKGLDSWVGPDNDEQAAPADHQNPAN